MPRRYKLVKLGKAYILVIGKTQRKVTVPPAIHNNDLLELHDTIVTTEEGEAYEIKENRSGEITFEEIPMAGISNNRAKNGSSVKMKKGANKKTSTTTSHSDELETGSEEVRVPGPKKICVSVQDLARKVHSVTLYEDSTIEQLYQKVSKVSGVPADGMRLIYGGRQLASKNVRKQTMVLSDYSIEDGCMVHLLLRLTGD